MRRTHKYLSIFLAIMMVLSIIPITASAAPAPYSGVCGDSLTWSFDKTTGTLIISGEGGMDDYAYYSCPWEDFKDEIENIVIDNGVTTVGHSAFSECINIESITIPESVNTIGEYAFSNCESLTKVVIPEGVTEIGDGAFNHCYYLDTVVIPGSVEAFGEDVFASCVRLANVTLSNGLTDIGLDTFDDCTSLTDIIIPEGVDSIRGGNFSGCYNLKSITIPVSVTVVGNSSFTDCSLLTDVYYTGTEEDWNNIEDYGNNDPLFVDATVHYNSAVHAHSYVKVGDVAKTCDVDGYTTYTCECGHSYKGDYVKAFGHNYDDGVVTTKPTCTVDGVKTFTCLTCDEGQYTETIPQTGHNYDDGVVTKDPTCTVEGVKTFTCGNCGDTYTETIDKVPEHDYQLVVNTSPDTTVCIKTYKCTICGDTYTETANASGHTRVVIPEFAPTETRAGLTAGVRCSSCDAVLIKQEVIPAFGAADDSSITSSGICGTNLTWTYNADIGTLTISGTGAMDTYSSNNRPWESYEDNIKSIIISDGVTTIGRYAFYDCDSLLYVSIPDSVTTIYGDAFRSCASLINVVIPDSVTTLASYVFNGCNKLVDVKFGSGVTSISDYAFTGCSSLMHVVLPESVYFIFDYAFQNCTSLKDISFSKNVSIISRRAFDGCAALTDVYYSGTETQWNGIMLGTNNAPLETAAIHYNSTGSAGDVGHKHDFTVVWVDPTCTENGYVSYSCDCGYEYIQYFDALGHSIEEIPVVLPTTETVGYTRGKKCTTCEQTIVEPVMVPILTGKGTAKVGDAGGYIIWIYYETTKTMEFFGKGYMNYYDPIQDSSYDIDERPWAVYGLSSVQYVIVHEGIKGINELSFYDFSGLKLIALPSSLEWIGDDAFYGCGNFYIKYDGTQEEWNKIDGHYENYGRIIFSDYSGVTASGTHGDNLTWTYDALTFTLTVSGTGPMESVEYNEYPWHEYLPEIETIIIKEGVATIGNSAFRGCDNCKSITIPSSVTKIEDMAFFPDDLLRYKLKDVYYLGTLEMWNNISVEGLNGWIFSYATIHFVDCAGFCGDNVTWMFDGSTLTISGTGDMHDYDVDFGGWTISPFADFADEVKHIVIGDCVTSIGDFAFDNFRNLETVALGSDITRIGRYAFFGCSKIETIKLSRGLTTIDDYAFYYCTSLTDITLPDSLTEIGSYAFCDCESLTSVIIPISVQTIGNGAFYKCTNLKDVYYEGTQEQWIEILPWIDFNPTFSNATIHYNYSKTFTGIKDNHFYKDDVMQKAYQLVEFDGDFYYIGDRHEIVKNKEVYLREDRINGLTYADGTLIKAGTYTFDENGKMIILNGPVGDYFYKNNEKLNAYQLVGFAGEFYYIGDGHKIVKNKEVYVKAERLNGLTYADGTPIKAGTYTFDENGKMIILNGPVGDYFYKNNEKLNAYQLVEIDGEFYYIGDGHKIVKNKEVYVKAERLNGLTYEDGTPLEAGYYTFDADGRLIIE